MLAGQSTIAIGSKGTLGLLRDMCGGVMRFKDISHLKPRALAGDYLDNIIYNGHAVRKSINAEIEGRMRSATLLNGIISALFGVE